jgi:hypothetical protein
MCFFSILPHIFVKKGIEMYRHIQFKPQSLKDGGKQALISERVLNHVV